VFSLLPKTLNSCVVCTVQLESNVTPKDRKEKEKKKKKIGKSFRLGRKEKEKERNKKKKERKIFPFERKERKDLADFFHF
jgi:hypothetical protein